MYFIYLRRIQMKFSKVFTLIVMLAMLVGAINVIPAAANTATSSVAPVGSSNRYMIKASSSADYSAMRADAIGVGAKVIKEIPHVNILVVSMPENLRNSLMTSSHVQAIAVDGVRSLVRPEMAEEMGFKPLTSKPSLQRIKLNNNGNTPSGGGGFFQDPAFAFKGLMWSIQRIRAPKAWKKPAGVGDPTVLVGVADTGLDFTHSELMPVVADVVDLTDPTLCYDYFGASDADLATAYGGPALTDWNGHGSWIGGNIAGVLDGVGVNGIAPNIQLVALKIAEWCGYAYDSSILDSFVYAADNGIDVVSISFGGYLDRTDPLQDAAYQDYIDVVNYALTQGTVIVAAAGNEHLRIGAGGEVLSHGPLTIPGTEPFVDYYGLWEIPGGVPGVVDVSSTGNTVNKSSKACAPGTSGSPADSEAVCKPMSDAHQPFGSRALDQLAYYSNYGPRIDVAAPGGARMFNLPTWDRGGTEGWPYTGTNSVLGRNTGYNAWEDFSITSNWAMEIPCFWLPSPPFYDEQCYSTIQGTSMATPHASAVVALIASTHPAIRHDPLSLIAALKASTNVAPRNSTPGLSATDYSAADRTGDLCPTGYCHLGGRAISYAEAYGAGLVDAFEAVIKNVVVIVH
jgi:subtilisin family serine protease